LGPRPDVDVWKERLTFCETEAFTAVVPEDSILVGFLCLVDLYMVTDVTRFESPRTISSSHDFRLL